MAARAFILLLILTIFKILIHGYICSLWFLTLIPIIFSKAICSTSPLFFFNLQWFVQIFQHFLPSLLLTILSKGDELHGVVLVLSLYYQVLAFVTVWIHLAALIQRHDSNEGWITNCNIWFSTLFLPYNIHALILFPLCGGWDLLDFLLIEG